MSKYSKHFWQILFSLILLTLLLFYNDIGHPFIFAADKLAIEFTEYIRTYQQIGLWETGFALMKQMSILGQNHQVYQWQGLAGLPVITYSMFGFFPIEDWMLRTIAYSLSLGGLIGVFFLGKELQSTTCGVLAAGLWLCNPLVVYFFTTLHPIQGMVLSLVWLSWAGLTWYRTQEKKYLVIVLGCFLFMSTLDWLAYLLLLAIAGAIYITFAKLRTFSLVWLFSAVGIFFLYLVHLASLTTWSGVFLFDQVTSYLFSFSGFRVTAIWETFQWYAQAWGWLGWICISLWLYRLVRLWWQDKPCAIEDKVLILLALTSILFFWVSPKLFQQQLIFQLVLYPWVVFVVARMITFGISLVRLPSVVTISIGLAAVCIMAYSSLQFHYPDMLQPIYRREWTRAVQLQRLHPTGERWLVPIPVDATFELDVFNFYLPASIVVASFPVDTWKSQIGTVQQEFDAVIVLDTFLPNQDVLEYLLSSFEYERQENYYRFQW